MSSSGVSDLERELLGKCASDSGWSSDEDEITHLPKGFVRPNSDTLKYMRENFSEKYDNGKPKFLQVYRDGWQVYRICPCGFKKCSKHVIPSEIEYTGSMIHEGTSLSRKFSKLPTLTTKETQDWWNKYPGTTTISSTIHREVLIKWPYEFPKGHELTGLVNELEADNIVHTKFSGKYNNNQNKYEVVGNKIFQLCECGLRECPIHIIPSTVKITAGFNLELHLYTRKRGRKGKRKNINPFDFGSDFRKMEPLTLQDARDWFTGIPLNYKVEVTPSEITLKMVCKCGDAFFKTPCDKCKERQFKPCEECGEKYKKRMLKKYEGKRICGNCHRKKLSFCDICKKTVPLGHTCLPLVNQHFSSRIHNIYPPLIRQKLAKFGICPDCSEGCSYNGYHRHQYRRHSDLKRCKRYTRNYTYYFCHYCDYANCDITNVREHEKFHYTEKMHKCRYCDMCFSRPSARALHHHSVHKQFSDHQSSVVKRQGAHVVREKKNETIQYLA